MLGGYCANQSVWCLSDTTNHQSTITITTSFLVISMLLLVLKPHIHQPISRFNRQATGNDAAGWGVPPQQVDAERPGTVRPWVGGCCHPNSWTSLCHGGNTSPRFLCLKTFLYSYMNSIPRMGTLYTAFQAVFGWWLYIIGLLRDLFSWIHQRIKAVGSLLMRCSSGIPGLASAVSDGLISWSVDNCSWWISFGKETQPWNM